MADTRDSGGVVADQRTPAPWYRRHPVRAGLVAATALAVALVTVLVLTPLADRDLTSTPDPAAGYAEAMAKAEVLAAADDTSVNARCRSRVLERGDRTEVAVVLLHGYTNCPAQWDLIAESYLEAGYNVVVPRLPGHGEQDRLSTALSDIGPQDLVATGDLAVDIAAGLGERVWVAGLSGGGTVAGWLTANRDEISSSVLIAPLVAPKVLPEAAVGPVSRAFRFTPDVWLWWDAEQQAALADPPYAYPRYSLRSLGAFLAVGRDAQRSDPARQSDLDRLVVLSNENDSAVSEPGIRALESSLERTLRADVEGVDRIDVVFATEDGYRHDLIDPEGENAEVLDEIYPRIGPLLGLDELSAP